MAQFFYDYSVIDKGKKKPVMAKAVTVDMAAVSDIGPVGSVDTDTGSGFLWQTNRDTGSTFTLGVGENFGDCEILYKCRPVRLAWVTFTNTGVGFAFRSSGLDGGTGRPNDGYYLAFGTGQNTDGVIRLQLFSTVANSQTTIANVACLPSANDETESKTDVYIRALISGSDIKARAWVHTETEPATWDIEETDTDHTSGDIGALLHSHGFGQVVYFLSVGTGGDPAPLIPPAGGTVVSGTLQTPASAPAAGYVVRCYHRDSGAIVGDTLSDGSGNFTMTIALPTSESVYCLAIDQLGNTWGADIKDIVAA
jgi:hypothetical protein